MHALTRTFCFPPLTHIVRALPVSPFSSRAPVVPSRECKSPDRVRAAKRAKGTTNNNNNKTGSAMREEKASATEIHKDASGAMEIPARDLFTASRRRPVAGARAGEEPARLQNSRKDDDDTTGYSRKGRTAQCATLLIHYTAKTSYIRQYADLSRVSCLCDCSF